MTNSKIKTELIKCQDAAENGYKLAKENCKKILRSLKNAENEINLANSKQNQLQNIQHTELISKQDKEIQNLYRNIEEICQNIDFLYDLRKDFSIAVFGRKMAGKSTLRKILTNGNGSSIGQHTATDINSYYWNGLKIIDAPSFDFFDNAEKDRRGMEIAKTADLVMFLLTNEKPQPLEIQCLAQLKSLGKPILCIVNFKKDLNFKKRNAALKELKKILSDTAAIDSVVTQFKESAKQFHQNWNDIEFLPTHLAAAYYAQASGNDVEFYSESKFDEVENFIFEKIENDGRFLRVKNFVDSVAVPMNSILLKLFEHGANSLKESKIISVKSKEILAWRQKFWDSSQKKLLDTFNELSEKLAMEIPKFVEENYNAKNINDSCTKFLNSLGYNERYQKLLEEFSAEYKDGLKKFSEELAQELRYSFDSKTATNIQIKDEDTLKKYLIAVAPNLLMLVPGINLATVLAVSIGNTILNLFIDKKTDHDSKAKRKLSDQIKKVGMDMLNQTNMQAHEVFNKQIVGKIEEFANVLVDYSQMFARLGKSQSKIAEMLIDDYSKLNTTLFMSALEYKDAGKFDDINATMRIPGTISVVISKNSKVDTKKISAFLNERFFVVNPLDSWEKIMMRMLGCEFELNHYTMDGKSAEQTYSVTPRGKVSAKRARLAQQISPYPIIIQ